MKFFLLISVWVLFIQSLFADIPTGYYDSATGDGYTLKTQLYNIIKDHTSVSYTPGVWDAFYTTDVRSDGKVWDTYSNCDFTLGDDQDSGSGGTAECQFYNREHSFPRSWFGGEVDPMNTDIFHIYPTDKKVNNVRLSYPFGRVGSASYTSSNGSELGTCDYPGYTGTVFEPTDEYKGDFARTYFYMATRYENVINGWENNDSNGDAVLNGTSDQVYEEWYLNIIIEWHNNDPVSQKEIDRNDAIYSIQNNRNPFIDHPEYVAEIWGGGGNSAPSITNTSISPTNPTSIDAVSVSATITDSDGTISSAELHWGLSSGSLTNKIPMSVSTGDTYITDSDIPAQAGGTNVYYIIEATDDDTETTQSGENSFSFSTIGNVLPEISDVGFTPIDPESAENVTVSATITDSDGSITTANIKWGTSTGNYPSTVSMSNSGDDYTGVIPAQADEAHVYFVIYTVDNDGGSAQSSENDYVVDDPNILPEISGVSINPTDPESTESVSVSATITDSDGTITTANIKWGTSTGNYTNTVLMSNSGDDYSGVISSQADGAEVVFIIEAEDNEAGITLSSEFNYTVEDPENQAPVISDVILDPSSPNENEKLIVSCVVDDADGSIEAVVLKWKRGAGAYTDVSMNFSGGRYYGQIPKQSVGETIYFSIIAEDNEGLQNSYEGSYEVSESSSIYNFRNNRLKIYPNPTRDNINIEFTESGFINSIKVYNLIGEKMLEISNLNTAKYTIELSRFPKGIYILQIDDSENSIVRKVMLK
jgi:endonuclease I